MLRSLQVRNFAIVDEVNVDFAAGMTVLTGETGAGKSILVDALGLVLGERGGLGIVREGTKRAEFSAEFDLADHRVARDWLVDQALDLDDECILRRVIAADGRSRAFINGNAVSLQSLKSLGELLLDIHGQHFHQSLGHRDVQRNLLDHFGGLQSLLKSCADAFAHWRALADELAEVNAAHADREARLELLEFQVQEFDALDLQPEELPALKAERQKRQNSGRLADGLSRVLDDMYDGESATAQSLLGTACQTLSSLSSYDETLAPTHQLLEEAGIQVAEATDILRRYRESLDADPNRQEWIEERLDAIQSIARKHKVEAEDLGEIRDRLRTQLDELRNAGKRSTQLGNEVSDAQAQYLQLASDLSAGRQRAAGKFGTAVTNAMAGLGMPGGVFEVSVESGSADEARAWGMDSIEYLISANPGQKPTALAKVASGGELSRMSLSIQVIASDGSQIPTMVFDEVDSGVGGGVAEMVGRRLCELGASRQVLCVTHLAQVAVQADNHFRINKMTDGKSTRIGVALLNKDERVEELARMLGGVEITQRTREHAAEMLAKGGRKIVARKRATR
ncbi:MAG: DNA repair protein RecN [Gammaproteobacteria bacterium]|nr:DNA repair protein RecN [Gammaproteobacteria bacterium]